MRALRSKQVRCVPVGERLTTAVPACVRARAACTGARLLCRAQPPPPGHTGESTARQTGDHQMGLCPQRVIPSLKIWSSLTQICPFSPSGCVVSPRSMVYKLVLEQGASVQSQWWQLQDQCCRANHAFGHCLPGLSTGPEADGCLRLERRVPAPGPVSLWLCVLYGRGQSHSPPPAALQEESLRGTKPLLGLLWASSLDVPGSLSCQTSKPGPQDLSTVIHLGSQEGPGF